MSSTEELERLNQALPYEEFARLRDSILSAGGYDSGC